MKGSMPCQSCGAPHSAAATHCDSCGSPVASPAAVSNLEAPSSPGETLSEVAHDIPSHLAMAIIATLVSVVCCCLPFGMLGVVPAVMVSGKVERGDVSAARMLSGAALGWSLLTILVCLGSVGACMLSSFSATAFLRSVLGV